MTDTSVMVYPSRAPGSLEDSVTIPSYLVSAKPVEFGAGGGANGMIGISQVTLYSCDY